MKTTVDYRTQSYAFISDNKSRSNADCLSFFCPEPNGIQMIVVGILIALIIAVTGGMIVAIYLIASTMLAGLSWVGLITG